MRRPNSAKPTTTTPSAARAASSSSHSARSGQQQPREEGDFYTELSRPSSATRRHHQPQHQHHHSNSNHQNRNSPTPSATLEEDDEDDELTRLNATDPRIAYAADLHQWGSHFVRLCADGATARPFPFLLDFEHAEPPPLFNHLVYHLPSERRHGVDKHLRRAGTIHLACAELHDPRDEFAEEQERLAKQQEQKEREQREREQLAALERRRQSQVGIAASSSVLADAGASQKVDDTKSSNGNNSGEQEEDKKETTADASAHQQQQQQQQSAIPTGGYMLHATLFLQLRILNHTYYLAPVDQAHREAVKRNVRRWIASARGPISPETGNLLLRYAVTIPRPSVRRQLQKIVDRARKEALPHHIAAAMQQQHQQNLARSRTANSSGGVSGERTDLPSVDPAIADGEEPQGLGTDGLASAQFSFRDPFLCAVTPEQPRSSSSTRNNNNNATDDEDDDDENNADDGMYPRQSKNRQQNQQQTPQQLNQVAGGFSPITARVENAPPLATVEQELVHGITMRDHQRCCAPHRMGLPPLLEDGWWASAQQGGGGSSGQMNRPTPQQSQNQQQQNQQPQSDEKRHSIFGGSATSGSAPPSRRRSTVDGSTAEAEEEQQDNKTKPQQNAAVTQHQQPAEITVPTVEEQTIHGALQVPHPFGRALSFNMSVKHRLFGEIHAFSANSLLEPLFYSAKRRKQTELSMESSFQFRRGTSGLPPSPSGLGAGLMNASAVSGNLMGSSLHSPSASIMSPRANHRGSSNASLAAAHQQQQQQLNSQQQQQYSVMPCTIFLSQLMTSCTTSDNALIVLLVTTERGNAGENSGVDQHRRSAFGSGVAGGASSSSYSNASPSAHAAGINDRLRILGYCRIWIEPVLHPSVTVAFSVSNMFRKHFYPCDPMLRLQRKNARELIHCPVGSVLPPSSWMTGADGNGNDNSGNYDESNPFRFIPRPPPATNLLHQTQTVFLSEAYHNRASALFRYCDMRLPFSTVSCSEGKPIQFADAVPRIVAAWHNREKQWLSRRVKAELLNNEARLAQLEALHYGTRLQDEANSNSKEAKQTKQEIAAEEKKKRRKQLGAFVFIGTSSDDDDDDDSDDGDVNKKNKRKGAAADGNRKASVDGSDLVSSSGPVRNVMHRTFSASQALLTQIENLMASLQDKRLVLSSIFPYAMLLPCNAHERKKALARSWFWQLIAIRPQKVVASSTSSSTSAASSAASVSFDMAPQPPSSTSPGRQPRRSITGSGSSLPQQQQATAAAVTSSRHDTSTVYATVEDEFVVEVVDLLYDPNDGSTKPSVVGTSVFSLQKLIDAFSLAAQQQEEQAVLEFMQQQQQQQAQTATVHGAAPAESGRNSPAEQPTLEAVNLAAASKQQHQQSPRPLVRWHRDLDLPDDIDLLTPPKMIELPFQRRTAFDDLHSRLRTSLDSGKGLTCHFADRLISFHPTTLRQDQSQVSRRFLIEKKERFRRTSVNVGIVGKETAQDSFARLFDTFRSEDNSRGVWDIGAMFVVDFCAGSSAAHSRRVFLDGSNMVRGVLRHVALQLYPYTGWCELAACSTNATDRQLSLQTLLRFDDFSMVNPFVEEQPFADPCVDPVYEPPRGVSELLRAYDVRAGSGQQNRRGTRHGSSAAAGGAFGGGGGGFASSALPPGLQMPFFLTPTLRHARRVAKARAQQEMEMDNIEAQRMAQKQMQQQQQQQQNSSTNGSQSLPSGSVGMSGILPPGQTNIGSSYNATPTLMRAESGINICVNASDWFGETAAANPPSPSNVAASTVGREQSDQTGGAGGDSNNNAPPGSSAAPRRRFFVVTVVVTGADIADAKNAAQLLDEMQAEPIVLLLIVLRKPNPPAHQQATSATTASTPQHQQQQRPFSANNTLSGTQTTRRRVVAFNDSANSNTASGTASPSDPPGGLDSTQRGHSHQQNQQQQQPSSVPLQNPENTRFENQLKEFRNRWNVIISVLDAAGDTADVHEGFDRLAMALREIPKVFISCARCLSHGPKGLRPPVTKASPLLVQARRKQLEQQQQKEKEAAEQAKKEQQQQQQRAKQEQLQKEKEEREALERQQEEHGDERAAAAGAEAGRHTSPKAAGSSGAANEQQQQAEAKQSKKQRFESAVQHRIRILEQDTALEPALVALREAVDTSYETFPGVQQHLQHKQDILDCIRSGTPVRRVLGCGGSNNASRTGTPTPARKQQQQSSSATGSNQQPNNSNKQVPEAYDATRESKTRRDVFGPSKIKRKTDDELQLEQQQREKDEERRRRRKRRATGEASWEAGDFDGDEGIDSAADDDEEAAERAKERERELRRQRRRLLAQGYSEEEADLMLEQQQEQQDDDEEAEETEEAEEEEEEENEIETTVTAAGPWGTEHVSFSFKGFGGSAAAPTAVTATRKSSTTAGGTTTSDSSMNVDDNAEAEEEAEEEEEDEQQQQAADLSTTQRQPEQQQEQQEGNAAAAVADGDDDDDTQQNAPKTVSDVKLDDGRREVTSVLGPKNDSAAGAAAASTKRPRKGGKKDGDQQQTKHRQQQRPRDPHAHPLCDTSITLVDVFVEELVESDDDY